ncbi:hypothetical protein BROUX41_002653 [Berkeleyomyces rouxiae]|uniref:uncharacterized protein n=1 Tax=Berkeleyomyces rouxiae TaxID=2035830 RepID=UPI003B810B05
MATAGLSSNWKKLQEQMKKQAPLPLSTSSKPESSKRKRPPAPARPPTSNKKQKTTAPAGSRSNATAKAMGNTQSSKIDAVCGPGVAPSLGLWSQSKGVCADDLADAYKLSSRTPFVLRHPQDKVNAGQTPDLAVGKYVSIDCEMVGVGPAHDSALARVSIVDFHGRQVYDRYVRPRGKVTDWRTAVSGIEPRHMGVARGFAEVQAEVAAILKDRILIGHDLGHDLAALDLRHPVKDIRDTAKTPQFKKYGHGRKPALRVLAQALLNVEIQAGAHSSVEDARVTMELFRRHKPGFDADHASRFDVREKQGAKRGAKKKSKKR